MARKKRPEEEAPKDAAGQPLRLEYVDPGTLAENPRNWRTHPQEQREALAEALDRVGWAGALLYNERTERLVDGHARLKHARAHNVPSVPVLIGNWSEDEEKYILATLDPLAAMAESDTQQLDALLREIPSAGEAISSLLAGLAEDAGLIPPDETEARQPKGEGGRGRSDEGDEGEGESEGGRKGKPGPESYKDLQTVYDYRLIFDDAEQQDQWFAFLKFLKVKFPLSDTVGARLSHYLDEIGIGGEETGLAMPNAPAPWDADGEEEDEDEDDDLDNEDD